VRELADALPISRPAVSRHLKLLKDAGLVADRAEGTRRLYRLHDEGIEAVQAYLQQVWGDAAARFKLLADNCWSRSSSSSPSPATLRARSRCGPSRRPAGGHTATRSRPNPASA
jgi:DNA-binding transcriptional ArsR family regulator